MMNMKGGVAVVTGGASGLGKAMAEEAARRGMKVVVADVEAGAMEKAVADLRADGAEAIGVLTDVTSAASVEALALATEQNFGPANLLFNNAGVASGGPIWESTEKDWKWLFGVNVDGVANGVRSFTPRMLAAAAADPRYEGRIVNTASMAGLVTAPGMGIYSVSKHAVLAMSECLYHDLDLIGRQVRAAVLCPFYVSTNISQCYRNRPADLVNDSGPTRSQLATQAISARISPTARSRPRQWLRSLSRRSRKTGSTSTPAPNSCRSCRVASIIWGTAPIPTSLTTTFRCSRRGRTV